VLPPRAFSDEVETGSSLEDATDQDSRAPIRSDRLEQRSGTSLLRSRIFRLWLVYLLLFGVAVVGLSAFVYQRTTDSLTRQIDATVDAEITGLAEQFRQRGVLGLVAAIERRAEAASERRGLYLLTDRNLTPLAGNLEHWPDGTPDDRGWLTFPLDRAAGAGGEQAYGRARLFDLGGRYRLLVGHDIRERLRLTALVRDALILGIGITVGLALIGALVISRMILGKVEAINAISREIIAGDLGRRIPVSERGDEFDRLAGNLNAMLDQIERLMEGLRQVTDNIAHDLRTPLARMRSRLEIALMDSAGPEDQAAAIERAIAEADGLLATFNALLSIAQAEAGDARESFAPVALGDLVEDAAALYEPIAEEKQIAIAIDTGAVAPVSGDRSLMFQAVTNLVDNAVKYAPAGSEIHIAVAEGTDGVRLSVCDHGPGIPEAEREAVVRRFYRLEASRSTPGSGLGLSLVDAVARLHGAKLTLADNHPGLCATLTFPATSAQTPRNSTM
jgi:signal transduction histidine kinase